MCRQQDRVHGVWRQGGLYLKRDPLGALWTWTNVFPSPSLSFITCKKGGIDPPLEMMCVRCSAEPGAQ